MEDGAGRPMTAAGDIDVLAGGGELGALMRAHDWSATPLGPPEHWPRSLRTAVRIMLTSRQPMWIGWGEKLTYLYNDAYKSIIGGKHPWALGRPTAEVWSEIWPDIQPMLATALAGDEGTYSEEQLLIMERNGYPEETYYTFSYSPIPDDNGLPGGIICANADDTQRVIGERQLALLRELATAAAEARSGHEACARSARALGSDLRDLPFALIYMAEEAGNAFVLAGASGIGSEHPAAPARIVAGESAPWPLEKALSGGDAMLMEGLGDRFGKPLPGGAWSIAPDKAALVPIVATGWQGVLVVGLSPVRLFDAGYRGFLSLAAGQIASAVSHAEAYEQERRRAEALAEIDRAKTVFFSNVSHEFRTPLTLMLGPLDELHDKLEEKGAAADAELAEVAHRNGLRLLRLVNSLLDFSRLEAGRIRARYRPVDLAAYTAELASNFRAACDRAGLELIVDCPSLARPAYVDCDMWEKIVLNLVSNAFKYTLDGRIEVKVRTHRDMVELTVRDTGVGIAEEELPRLFDRFHRIEGQRGRTQEGSGIGLALVQELVGLHGGSIDAESREGEGTCFRITLPLGKEHLPPDHIELEGEAARPGQAAAFVEEAMRWLPGDVISGAPSLFPPEGGGARVLVADDNADMRDYVVRLVAELGHEVEAVSDGQAALEAARRETPDLILTDVMMPRLDGFGLVAAVRGDPRLRDTPIIMLSARAGEEARVEGIRSGADDYLTKPFSARELAARVSGNLAIAGLRRQTATEIRESELRLRRLFDQAPSFLAILRGPDHIYEFANAAYRALFGNRNYIGNPVSAVFPEVQGQGFIALLDRVFSTGERYVGLGTRLHLDGNGDFPACDFVLDFIYEPVLDAEGNVTGIFVEGQDVSARHRAETELRDQSRILETLNRTGAELAAELDLERLVQKVTDAGRELIGAEFGAFFYNVTNTDGESFRLYTLSGAKRSDFDKFPQPRNTGVFGPTFRGEGPVRSDDITRDARYGHNPPYNGMPKGHLPVRSYLAVPVISREGEVIGGLFYGHAEPGRFKERDERLLIGIAGQTSIALDNARLYQAAQREIIERQRAEALREVQNRVLELAIRDKSLEETLDALVRTIESHSTTGMLGSVLLADQEGGRLRHGAAPSLPDAYNRAIDGIAIGPDVGSCGSAAHSGKPVYVADIATDPRWADFRDLALSHGLQACWSTPILSGQGEVLGTFALYYSEPRHPPSDDLEMVDFVTRSVALVIERKRSEEALRESEAHFAALVGQTSAGLAETDLQGRFTNVNDRYCAIVGRSRDELIGRPLQEITHPDDIARNMALFERMVRDGEQYEIEKRYVRPDGSIVWVNNNVNLIRPTQGKQASVLAVCIDTTERKASEEARERFVALIETSQDFIGFATPDGIPQYMNPAGERLVGLTVAEARDRGITIRDYFFPADRERLEEHILPIVLRKGSWAGEFTLRNFRTGAAIPMWFDVFVVRDGRTGKTLNICTVSRDLTAQKRSEAELRRLNEALEQRFSEVLAERKLLAELVETTDALILALDFDYNIMAVNRACSRDLERIYGVQAGVGDNLLDLLSAYPEEREKVRATWGRALAGEEFTIVDAFGDPERDRPSYEIKFSIVRDREGRPIGSYQFVYDVTERLRREAELQEMQEQLRQAQKMEAVGQLTGGIAHDFNNLLTIITGNLDIIDRSLGRDEARVRRAAGHARKGAERAASLTQRLLAFSRRQPLAPKPIDVDRLVLGMSDLLNRALGETIRLETITTPGLWRVEADPNQLENSLLNLAVNARDAMPQGGRLTIETANAHLDEGYAAAHTGVAQGNYVVIAVSDTGSGMSRETLERVFEPFFTTKEVGRGTGLGLSMVYGFVKQSGGHVKVYSEEGQGTTVKIYLPRLLSGDAPEEDAEEPLLSGEHRGETILVAEDDEDVRAYTAEILRELGYSVIEAHDGPAALRLLAQPEMKIDLLLTDVVMPEMSGRELADQALQLRSGLRILYTSGYTRNAIVHDGRLDRGVEMIAKPFTYQALSAKVRELLEAGSNGRVLVIAANDAERRRLADALVATGHMVEEAANGAEALGKLRVAAGYYDALLLDPDLPGKPGEALIADIRAMHRALPVLLTSAGDAEKLRARFADDRCVAVIGEPGDAEALAAALERLGVRCRA